MAKRRKIIALPILDNNHPDTFRKQINTIKHFFNTKTDGEAILQAINFTLKNMTNTIPPPTVNTVNSVDNINKANTVNTTKKSFFSSSKHDKYY